MHFDLPKGRPLFIGSLPMTDHSYALQEVLRRTPETPHWVQLPVRPEEGFLVQFCQGLPGLGDARIPLVRSHSETFEEELLAFYQDYVDVTEHHMPLDGSRFSVSRQAAPGLYLLLDALKGRDIFLVKGQMSGPVSVLLGIRDEEGRSVYYDERLRDVTVKLLSLKAKWQALRLRGQEGRRCLVFVDEPAMGGLGSSVYIGVDPQEALAALDQVLRSIHEAGAWAGVHVCSNADWGTLLRQSLDVLSFDAFFYFERLALFSQEVSSFLQGGGMLAWGIVPTSPQHLQEVDALQLASLWKDQALMLCKGGITPRMILEQSFVTPSCGLGGVETRWAHRAMDLTVEVSRILRKELAL